MTNHSDIDFFFAPPQISMQEHTRDGQYSVLYLLRRELLETMGYHPDLESEDQAGSEGARNQVVCVLVLTFTGFDLLAKFAEATPMKWLASGSGPS